MTSPIKKTMWRNTSLKIISVIFGYSFWYIFSSSHISTMWITVPLCFYNVPNHMSIKGPETISVQLLGKRSELCALDREHLAVHINAEHFTIGTHQPTITEQTIFLPESIKLVHYSPSNPTIELAFATESMDS